MMRERGLEVESSHQLAKMGAVSWFLFGKLLGAETDQQAVAEAVR